MAISDWEDTLNRVAAGAFATAASITNGINEDGQNKQESKPIYNLHKNFISGHIGAVFNDPQFLSFISGHRLSIRVNNEIMVMFVNFINKIHFTVLNEFLNFIGSVRVSITMNIINWDIEDGGVSLIRIAT